jgi:hypothetical protein
MTNHRKTQFRALIIAYWFPPMSVHTWRSWYVFQELKKIFSEVSILTTSHRKHLSKLGIQDTDQRIIEIPTLDYRRLYFFRKKSTAHVAEKKKTWLNFWLYYLLNSFQFNLLVGEGGVVYQFIGWRAALKLVQNGEVSFIFSSFRPYADHCIAWLVKRSHPEIFWVADFRDLHLNPVLKETFFPPFQKWCTRKILAKADVVTTVSKGLAAHLKLFHPNVVLLRNGIGELANMSNLLPATHHQSSTTKFTITYTGSMSRWLCSPILLLEVLAEMVLSKELDPDKFEILYAGKDQLSWDSFIQKTSPPIPFRTLGLFAHEKAIQLQQNAHINLLLTYSSHEISGILTGKLYEYLAARRPILLMVDGVKDDELEEIFLETNAGLIVYNQIEMKRKVRDFILELYEEWLATGEVSHRINPQSLEKYRWENMMPTFLEDHFFAKKR